MEVGAEYSKKRFHGTKYFQELLGSLTDVPESMLNLLLMSRSNMEFFKRMQKALVRGLRSDPKKN